VSRELTFVLLANMSILVYRIQLCKLAEYPNLYLQDIIWSLAPSNTTKIRCYRLSSAFFAFAFLVIDSAHGFVFWDRKKIVSLCALLLQPFDIVIYLFTFFSLFSHVLKCSVPKDSNIAGFTICAYWDKASRSYEISIAFTYAASIVCSSPFQGCW
jgi:hypothetical protein